MRRFRPGQRVVLRTAFKRNRRHKYGAVRLRKGSSGRVVQRWQKALHSPRYDVDFSRRRRRLRVRKVPAAALRRPRHPVAAVLAVLVLLLVLSYLARRR